MSILNDRCSSIVFTALVLTLAVRCGGDAPASAAGGSAASKSDTQAEPGAKSGLAADATPKANKPSANPSATGKPAGPVKPGGTPPTDASGAANPEASKPEAAKPEAPQPATPEAAKPEAAKPKPAKPKPAKPEAGKSTAPNDEPSIDAKALYLKRCKSCHGVKGDADTKMGRKHEIDSWKKSGWKAKWSQKKIEAIVRDGKPDTKMKSFAKKLSPAEIRAVSAYARKLGR